MTTFTPAPKPVRDTTDYQAKAIEVAAKIATFDGRCGIPGCRHTREIGWDIVAHHIIHRKYSNTCAVVENLFPVCVACHSRIHHDEQAFRAWLETVKPGLYDQLFEMARRIEKVDFTDVYSDLLERLYEMLRARRERESGEGKA